MIPRSKFVRRVLIGISSLLSPAAFAWGPPHEHISRVAMERLPEWQREFVKAEIDAFCKDYCYYPDKFFTPEAKPYVMKDPADVKAINHIPASRTQNETVFRHYFPRAMEAFAKGQTSGGMKYLGCVTHFLEDSSSPGHLPFGETRVDPLGPPLQQQGWLMDLLEVSDETRNEWVHLRIDHCPFTVEELRKSVGDYRPVLLGETVEELVFHLGERHQQMNLRSARQLIPMILALDRKDDPAFKAHGLTAATGGAKLVADVLYTALCIARNRFDERAPAQVNLSAFTPATWTAFNWTDRNHQGRFIRNASGAWHAKEGEPKELGRHPLKLRLPDGTTREFKTGFGVGHRSEYTFLLPKNVFRAFTVWAGNDAVIGSRGTNTFDILLDGKVAASTGKMRGAENPAEHFEVTLDSATNLTLRVQSDGVATATHGVWAEPMLVK